MGRSELRSCRSLVRQALRCMLKAEAWPLSRDAPGWRADAIDFRRQARDAFTPSMRQRIDLAGLYADALAATPETLDGQAPLPLPETCPVTLDELLGSRERMRLPRAEGAREAGPDACRGDGAGPPERCSPGRASARVATCQAAASLRWMP
jgi:hypothetical protein